MKRFFQVVVFCFSSLFIHTVIAQVNLQNGLVAYYPFNGTVNDISGNNLNGTIVNGIEYAPDRFGNPNAAAKFNGNNNYISVPDNGKLSTPNLSISLWFKTESNSLQNLIGKRKFGDDGTQGGGAQYQFFINYNLYPGIGSNLVGNNSSCTTVRNSSYLNTVEPICKERWYHAVITYDGLIHKIYINGVLKKKESTSFNSFLICNSELRFGVWWMGGTLPYQGLMDDIRWYNRALNENEISALYDNYSLPSQLDFTYNQNPCSPKSIQFFSANTSGFSYKWDFGNGNTTSSIYNPALIYNSFGSYPVKLSVQTSPGCTDSVEKIISVNIAAGNNILTPDTTICVGSSLRLSTDSGYSFCWSQNSSITNKSANATIKPVSDTTFFLQTLAPSSANLVSNGNFSSGNSNFLSGYSFTSNNSNIGYGQYGVTNSPNSWNSSAKNCTDNSSGLGNMLVVNSSADGLAVWQQTIVLKQNTNYVFSFWMSSLADNAQAKVQQSINSNPVGAILNSGTISCFWQQYIISWNSGNLKSVSLAILNKNLIKGVLFAIDDISFREASMIYDSVRIKISLPPSIKTRPDTAICQGISVKLSATGGTVYSWFPGTGLSDPNSQNPVAKPDTTTSYTVSAYNAPGCAGTATVKIAVLKSPDITLTNDTTICAGTKVQLSATGGATYQWTPPFGLNATNINNPVASPADTTKYFVTVTNTNGCSNTDSVVVKIASQPSVSTITDTSRCLGVPVILQTSVYTGAIYSWSPGGGLSDSAIASPVATPTGTTDYIVTAKTAENCFAKDTVRVTILNLPVITSNNDTTVCVGQKANLSASGGTNYKWSPVTGLSNPNISNPVALTNQTTTYKVLVTGGNGCSNSDSVILTVRPVPDFKIQPLTASVCKKDTINLTASGGDIYHWLNIGSLPPDSAFAIVRADTSATYKVRISDSVCNRVDTLSAVITVKPQPLISIQKSNDIDCTYLTAQLTASGGTTFSWSPAAGLNNPTAANPVVSPSATTTYKVKVTNAQGCSNDDTVRVIVKFTGSTANYNLPTAFTPNGDYKNDCFGIKSWGPVSQLDFSVFNRWGERVFYTKNPADCWDGRYKNIPQNTGGFVYYIKATTVCGGEFSRKGTVVLLR